MGSTYGTVHHPNDKVTSEGYLAFPQHLSIAAVGYDLLTHPDTLRQWRQSPCACEATALMPHTQRLRSMVQCFVCCVMCVFATVFGDAINWGIPVAHHSVLLLALQHMGSTTGALTI